ncbi:hypothetical protein KC640_01035 [Candidatus Dojkabacteria bacterium]|uniref:Uncharacterized protein n=1 Tax=Candidatus Dojkabacteria bacterium TaxID=2099670 RepID=A0A955ICT5_9BACT|nr:hypothetical protein [Candidatus Dojkabacteria bacterium]
MQKRKLVPQKLLTDPFTRKFLLVTELLLGAIFIVIQLKLPTPPSTFPFTIGAIVTLCLFLLAATLSIYIDCLGRPQALLIKRYIVSFIVLLALLAFVVGSQPAYKTHHDANSYTQTRRTAAATGNEAANTVKSGELTATEAEQRITEKYQQEPEAEQIAKEAFTLSLSNEDSTDSVISEVVQTIPVNVGMWTCNDIGCSYADDEYVWTSTNSNRILTSALVIFATTILFWIINGEYIAKMVQQEEAIQPV